MVRRANNREPGDDNSVWGMLFNVYGQAGVKEVDVGLVIFALNNMTYSQSKIVVQPDIEPGIETKPEYLIFDVIVENLRHQVKRSPVALHGPDIRRHIHPESQPGVVPGRSSKMAGFRDLGQRNFRSRDLPFIIQLQ